MYKLPINNSTPIPLMTENRKTLMFGSIISAILFTIDKKIKKGNNSIADNKEFKSQMD